MKKNKTDPAKTLLVLTIGFLLVYLITKWKAAIYISLGIGLVGIFSDYVSEKINYLWMKLAWLLSLIIPNVVLTILFFLFLVPLSFLYKIFSGKDTLNLKNKPVSLFKTVNKEFDKRSFEKPW